MKIRLSRITDKNTSKTQVLVARLVSDATCDDRLLGEVGSIPPRVHSVGKFGFHSKRVS